MYELGVRHSLASKTIIIAQNRNDIPFDLQSYANHVYKWKTQSDKNDFKDNIKELILDIVNNPSRLDNPVFDFLQKTVITAGIEIAKSAYSFNKVVNEGCKELILTGHNFAELLKRGSADYSDKFKSRDNSPYFINLIIDTLCYKSKPEIYLFFAPPKLLEMAHPTGYNDLIKFSIPALIALYNSPRINNVRSRLHICSIPGALSATSFTFIDMYDKDKALVTATVRWLTDKRQVNRMFFAVRFTNSEIVMNELRGQHHELMTDFRTSDYCKPLYDVVAELINENRIDLHEIRKSGYSN